MPYIIGVGPAVKICVQALANANPVADKFLSTQLIKIPCTKAITDELKIQNKIVVRHIVINERINPIVIAKTLAII